MSDFRKPIPLGSAGIDQLTGDVTAGPGAGSQPATVASVGGKTAAQVATGVTQAGTAVQRAGDTMTGQLNVVPPSGSANIVLSPAQAVQGSEVVFSGTSTNTGRITGTDDPANPNSLIISSDIAGGVSLKNTSGSLTLKGDGSTDAGSHQIHSVTNPTAAQDAATKSYVDSLSYAPAPVLSSASVGGAANEQLTVTGLLTTKIIYAVSAVNGGANNVSVTGYANDTNGSLHVFWTANPGAGAKVLVLFK